MKKGGKQLLVLTILLISIASCSKKDLTDCSKEEITIDSKEEINSKKSIVEVDKKEFEHFSVKYEVQNSNLIGSSHKDDKREALTQLLTEFIPYVSSKIDKSKNEFASFIIKNDKEDGIISIENIDIYKPENMSPMELSCFLVFCPKESFKQTTEKEKLKVSCEGGENNGKFVTVDRPTGKMSSIKFAKEIAELALDSLDEGGCLKVCKAEMSVS